MSRNNQQQNRSGSLSDYFRSIFDLNKDGKVTLKEIVSTMIPSSAVGIAFIVVDLLVAVAEYRVWDVGMQITGSWPKALGFVLVSALPFYLAQILWLYPLASGLQQGIALLMGASALYISASFGFADLSQAYDVTGMVRTVSWLTAGYVVALLLYIISDRNIRLIRARTVMSAQTSFQKQVNKEMRRILGDLQEQMQIEQGIRSEFGDDVVDDHLKLAGALSRKNSFRENGNGSQPLPPPAPTYPRPIPKSRDPEPVNPPTPSQQD